MSTSTLWLQPQQPLQPLRPPQAPARPDPMEGLLSQIVTFPCPRRRKCMSPPVKLGSGRRPTRPSQRQGGRGGRVWTSTWGSVTQRLESRVTKRREWTLRERHGEMVLTHILKIEAYSETGLMNPGQMPHSHRNQCVCGFGPFLYRMYVNKSDHAQRMCVPTAHIITQRYCMAVFVLAVLFLLSCTGEWGLFTL